MKDSWIDKDELDDLVSGFTPRRRAETSQQNVQAQDIFDDIPSIHIPRSRPVYNQPPQSNQVSPHLQPAAQARPAESSPSPLQVLVNPSSFEEDQKISSPFAIDEDDEFDDIEDQIESLASEAAKALRVLQEIRAKADQNGLIAKPEPEKRPIQVVENPVVKEVSLPADEPETVADPEPAKPVDVVKTEPEPETVPEPEVEIEKVAERLVPLDRIPLDVEIDSHLSLKGRLMALANILSEYVGMEEMMVVDRDGFSLFSTSQSLTVEKSVGQFVKSIRKVYASETDARSHTASQLAIEGDRWLCVVSTDGQISGQFLMKALLPEPLDRPEIYVLVELLNEVLRPEAS